MKYSMEYPVFPATFHVISRKIDFLWDSAPADEAANANFCELPLYKAILLTDDLAPDEFFNLHNLPFRAL